MSDTPIEGLNELLVAVNDLRVAVDGERVAREENTAAIQAQIANETANRNAQIEGERTIRRRANRRLLGVVFIIAIMSGFFIRQNNDRILDVENARQQSRINTCLADNESAARVNTGNEAKRAILAADREIQVEINTLIEPFEAQPLPADPVQAQKQAGFIATFEASKAKVEATQVTADAKITAAEVPLRDCSPAAVNAFYTSH